MKQAAQDGDVGFERLRLGVVIASYQSEESIAEAIQGVRQDQTFFDIDLVVVDGGSTDRTVAIARENGARVLSTETSLGIQIATGINAVRGEYLLLIHGETLLGQRWPEECHRFVTQGGGMTQAGYFKLQIRSQSGKARMVERLAKLRIGMLGLPWGAQGLFLSRVLLGKVGGYRRLPAMEDADIARRIGKRNLVELPVAAKIVPRAYERYGWMGEGWRRFASTALYVIKVPPEKIAESFKAR